jgi:hypothetical protein
VTGVLNRLFLLELSRILCFQFASWEAVALRHAYATSATGATVAQPVADINPRLLDKFGQAASQTNFATEGFTDLCNVL